MNININVREKVKSILRKKIDKEEEVVLEDLAPSYIDDDVDEIINYISNRIVGQEDAIITLLSNIFLPTIFPIRILRAAKIPIIPLVVLEICPKISKILAKAFTKPMITSLFTKLLIIFSQAIRTLFIAASIPCM